MSVEDDDFRHKFGSKHAFLFLGIMVVAVGVLCGFGVHRGEVKSDTSTVAVAESITDVGSDVSKPDSDVHKVDKASDSVVKSETSPTPVKEPEDTNNIESVSLGMDAVSTVPEQVEPESNVVDLGTSVQAFADFHAHDGGLLCEWEPGYYIAHEWSEPGKLISSLSVGSTFCVDGNTYVVTGAAEFVEDTPYMDVRDVVGWDSICLQTCIPNSNLFEVLYVSGVGDFSAYVHQDGYWTTRDESLAEEAQAQWSEDSIEGYIAPEESVSVIYGSISSDTSSVSSVSSVIG